MPAEMCSWWKAQDVQREEEGVELWAVEAKKEWLGQEREWIGEGWMG